MFYPNMNVKKRENKKSVTFTNFENTMDVQMDDALLPYKTAKLCYNFNASGGSLKNGIGFKELSLPCFSMDGERQIIPPDEKIKKVWHYKYYSDEHKTNLDELVFYCETGNLYICQINSDSPFVGKLLEGLNTSAVPNALNYRLNSEDALIISSQSDGMWKYVKNNIVQKVEDAPHIQSMCVHYERLFAVVGGERNRLAFSANLDPTNWKADLSSGGFIDMQDERGGLCKVLSYNDYIYVFRDFGVARLSAYGDQSDFSVSQLFVSSVKLYGNTVTLCGNKILLLARDGICSFDGYSTTKLNLGIEKLFEGVENDNACGLYYNNKFYLACRLNFNDGEKVGCENYEDGYINNAIVCIDLSTNQVSLTRGVDISSFTVIDNGKISKVVACFNGEHSTKLGELTQDGKIFGNILPKKWQSPKSNMGYPTKVKHIKECLIKTKSPCKIKISTNKETKEFDVLGKDISQRIKLNVKGEQIEVAFTSNFDGETDISCPQITVGITT